MRSVTTTMFLMTVVASSLFVVTSAFHLARPLPSTQTTRATSTSSTSITITTALNMVLMNRKEAILSIVGGGGVAVAALSLPMPANADVSSGDMPDGAAQFNRIVRLKRDLKGVKKRVAENAADIDKVEWDNIGKFLRTTYKTGEEDMTIVAKSIKNAENYARAMESIDKLKTYARAGDVSVSKQDGPGFVAVAEKMQGLVNDYFDALIDIPDEL